MVSWCYDDAVKSGALARITIPGHDSARRFFRAALSAAPRVRWVGEATDGAR